MGMWSNKWAAWSYVDTISEDVAALPFAFRRLRLLSGHTAVGTAVVSWWVSLCACRSESSMDFCRGTTARSQ